jgi:NAD(P)-dependent dehydrogenase (short-subunit alcohol dehydrogenase family)
MKYAKYLGNFPSLKGKYYIVTGANSGLGFDTSLHLAYKGADVILACRNLKKANEAKDKILQQVPNARLHIEQYDQASFKSIDEFAFRISKNYQKIDGLVCNAGVYFPKQDYKTSDGFELTFGTNYLGTYRLLFSMKEKLHHDFSRVVIVTSLTATLSTKKIDIDEYQKLNRNKIYGYSKYCLNRLFAELINKQNNITFNLVHPGIASTNIISSDQTGLPHWFQVLGHKFLTLFTHSSSKASLILLEGLLSDQYSKYIVPRGLFGISGYPRIKNVPKFANKAIIEKTNKIIGLN